MKLKEFIHLLRQLLYFHYSHPMQYLMQAPKILLFPTRKLQAQNGIRLFPSRTLFLTYPLSQKAVRQLLNIRALLLKLFARAGQTPTQKTAKYGQELHRPPTKTAQLLFHTTICMQALQKNTLPAGITLTAFTLELPRVNLPYKRFILHTVQFQPKQ